MKFLVDNDLRQLLRNFPGDENFHLAIKHSCSAKLLYMKEKILNPSTIGRNFLKSTHSLFSSGRSLFLANIGPYRVIGYYSNNTFYEP